MKKGFLFVALLFWAGFCLGQTSDPQQARNYCFTISNTYVAAAEARNQGISPQKFAESYSPQAGTTLPKITIENIANQVYNNPKLAKEMGDPLRRLALNECMRNKKQ